jgi:hypothetical protein
VQLGCARGWERLPNLKGSLKPKIKQQRLIAK